MGWRDFGGDFGGNFGGNFGGDFYGDFGGDFSWGDENLTWDFWGFSALGAGGGAVGKGMRFSSPALGSSSVVLRPKCWRKYSVVQ